MATLAVFGLELDEGADVSGARDNDPPETALSASDIFTSYIIIITITTIIITITIIINKLVMSLLFQVDGPYFKLEK
jgi:hypothetical protein